VALVILGRINELFKKGEKMMIFDFLKEGVVSFLSVSDRDKALRELVHSLKEADKIQDEDHFYEAILKREKIVSTGIGMGVAIPHAKLGEFQEFFIAVGIQKEGIEWDAFDGAPVRFIFMIGGPANRQTDYLKILSGLTMAIKDEKRRKNLLKTKTHEEIIHLFEGC
jgi:PTS system nitrogen regulatory IIA component